MRASRHCSLSLVSLLTSALVLTGPAAAEMRPYGGNKPGGGQYGGGNHGGGNSGGGRGIGVGIGIGIGLGIAGQIARAAAEEREREARRPRPRAPRERDVVTPRPPKPPTKRPPVIVDVPPKPTRTVPPRVATPESTRPGCGSNTRCRPNPPRPPVVVLPLPPPTLVAVPPAMMPPVLPPADRGTPPPIGQPGVPPPPPLAGQMRPEFIADEVLITVASATPETFEAAIAQQFNLTILDRAPLTLVDARLVRLRIPDTRTVPAVVAAVQADPRVALAQPNYLYFYQRDPAGVQPAVASGGMQYALVKLGVGDAHRLAQGRGVKIAVIDSGVDRAHPDLAGADITEFDAAGGPRVAAADADPHGTGITGILAARGTVRGLAPGSQVFSARIFSGRAGAVSANTFALMKGLDWSVAQGARLLNLSIAGPRDPLVERAVATFPQRGLIAIAAAGNNGPSAPPAYPAAYPEVIAVTATDEQDRLYEKANRGPYVALAAPGVDVLVPAVGAAHHFQSGTSFAAAHVTGIVALMLEMQPALTPEVVRRTLTQTSDDLGTPGPDATFGAGRIHAAAALRGVGPRPVRLADDKP
jgi:subtilisin family serine protease